MQKVLTLFCILFYLTIFTQSPAHAASTEAKDVKQVMTPEKKAKQSTEAITKSTKQRSPVNINKASPEAIAASLKGIGVKKANAIVAFREANGSFKSVDEITLVKGIGPQTLKTNKDLIKLK